MPTRDQVTELLDGGASFERAGRVLGIPPGQAYMIATGLPADDGDAPSLPRSAESRGMRGGSSQQLVDPPAGNPTRDETMLAWVRGRAARELTQRAQ